MAKLPVAQFVSDTAEDYLKQIYKLEVATGKAATTSALADRLNVSTAAVTNMLKRMAQKGLVNHKFYRGATLTPAGRKVAVRTVRRHRLLEVFLVSKLGYTWDQVHEEAEHLEHHVSEQFEERLAALLKHPKTDPHGSLIPTADLKLDEPTYKALNAVTAGSKIRIVRVAGTDGELLRFLANEGLVPGAVVEVLEVAPFSGPLKLRVGERDFLAWHEIAKHIYVEDASPKA